MAAGMGWREVEEEIDVGFLWKQHIHMHSYISTTSTIKKKKKKKRGRRRDAHLLEKERRRSWVAWWWPEGGIRASKGGKTKGEKCHHEFLIKTGR